MSANESACPGPLEMVSFGSLVDYSRKPQGRLPYLVHDKVSFTIPKDSGVSTDKVEWLF